MDIPVAVAGWSNQAHTFLTLIDAYKTKEMFCDCTLACKEKLFRAHKMILAMCSELFERIFMTAQDQNPVIILHEIEAWQIECLLNYMYKGETRVSDANFLSLCRVAKYLQIKGFDKLELYRQAVKEAKEKESRLCTHKPHAEEVPFDRYHPSKLKIVDKTSSQLSPATVDTCGKPVCLTQHKGRSPCSHLDASATITIPTQPFKEADSCYPNSHIRPPSRPYPQTISEPGIYKPSGYTISLEKISSYHHSKHVNDYANCGSSKYDLGNSLNYDPDRSSTDLKDCKVQLQQKLRTEKDCHHPGTDQSDIYHIDNSGSYDDLVDHPTFHHMPRKTFSEQSVPFSPRGTSACHPESSAAYPLLKRPASVTTSSSKIVLPSRSSESEVKIYTKEEHAFKLEDEELCFSYQSRSPEHDDSVPLRFGAKGQRNFEFTASCAKKSVTELEHQGLSFTATGNLQQFPRQGTASLGNEFGDTFHYSRDALLRKSKPYVLRDPPPLLKIQLSRPPSSHPEETDNVNEGSKAEFRAKFTTTDPLLEKIPTNKRKRVRGPKSWEFLLRLLRSPTSNPSLIKWEDEAARIFRLTKPEVIAQRWGQRTGKHVHDVLSYESFSRGLRYHYATGALCAVSEKSFVYQFGPKAQKALRGSGTLGSQPSSSSISRSP